MEVHSMMIAESVLKEQAGMMQIAIWIVWAPALETHTKMLVAYVIQMISMIVLPILSNFNREQILSVSMPCLRIYPSAQFSPAWVIMRNILLVKAGEHLISLEFGMEACKPFQLIVGIGLLLMKMHY